MNGGSRKRKKKYDSSRYVVLKGCTGVVQGEIFRVYHGQTVVVGRSSTCDISLKRCKGFPNTTGGKGGEGKPVLKVSRKHFRLTFANPHLVEIEDLSQNGTYVNGNRIDKIVITDLEEKEYAISFGEQEVLVLTSCERGECNLS